jgi:PTH1 family peptidyl-tRNA hydrolase
VAIEDRVLWLLKPTTYMNRSGLAVRTLTEYLRITPAETLVAHDELDLPVGVVRLKQGGGAGGHNGLKDIITQVGDGFWRLRFGIGHPGNRHEVIDYVLRRAPASEQALLDGAIAAGADSIPRLLTEGAEKIMNGRHRRAPAP